MITLQSVLTNIVTILNQDTSDPTGTEVPFICNIINQSQNEWAEFYQWRILRKTYSPQVQASMTSIGLPGNFKKLMSPVMDVSPGINSAYKYSEIDPNERFYKSSTDKYVYVSGNTNDGFYLTINPALASGASITFDIYTAPSSLATTTDPITCPNTQYLTARSLYKIFAARSDPRFTFFRDEADEHMQNMVSEDVSHSLGMDNTTPNMFKNNNLRVGEF